MARVRVLRRAQGLGGRRSSATTGCPRSSTCSRSAWASRSCARGPSSVKGTRRCSSGSGGSTGCGGSLAASVLPRGVVLGRAAAAVRDGVGRQGVREGDSSTASWRSSWSCPRCSGSSTGRHAPVPAAAADGVPRDDLVRDLPVAPGVHREDPPVGRLERQRLPNGPFLEHLIPTLVLTIIVASLSWYPRGAAVAAASRTGPCSAGRVRRARPPRMSTTCQPPDAEPAAITRAARRVRRAARVAALAIVVLHVTSATGAVGRDVVRPVLRPARRGRDDLLRDLRVPAVPAVRRRAPARSQLDRVGVFWWRRGLRIFPAYWVALTAAILLFGATHLLRVLGLHAPLPARADLPTEVRPRRASCPRGRSRSSSPSTLALPLYAWVLGAVTRAGPVARRVDDRARGRGCCSTRSGSRGTSA